MIGIVHGPQHREPVAQWVFANLGMRLAKPYDAVGIVRDGRLIGGVVFNGYNGANVDLTIYGPGCISRRMLEAISRHVFIALQCTRATARTRRDNKLMHELLPRLGFRPEGTQPRYYGSKKEDDAVVYGVLARNCPWLRTNDNIAHQGALNGRAKAAGSG